jgi:hypothetical protein
MKACRIQAGHRGRAARRSGAFHDLASSIQPTSFLRRVLMADAGISAVVGALMAAGAGPCSG